MRTAIDDEMFSPEAMADPYSYFGAIRDTDPVHWNETYEVWVIASHEDLVWVARRHELFSSAYFKNDPRPPYPPLDEENQRLYGFIREFLGDMFIQHDRPEHTDMRKALHSYFVPKSIERWRPLVKSAIDELLDDAENKVQFDLMDDFAVPLPVLVIAEALGVAPEDRHIVRQVARKLLNNGRAEDNRMALVSECIEEFSDYASPVIDDRLARPRDDLFTAVAEGERRRVFNRRQTLATALLLLFAGHETTINLLCNGVLAFLNNPGQWALFKSNPGELAARATEEALRYDAPVKSITRLVSQDLEMKGKTLKRLDRVRWVISSANRDPKAFDNPDVFDITRWPNPHVAFGSGIHHCLGATLARLEGQESFMALASRFPDLSLTGGGLEYHPNINARSLKALPVSVN